MMKRFVEKPSEEEKIRKGVERDNALSDLKDLAKEIMQDKDLKDPQKAQNQADGYNIQVKNLMKNAMDLGVSDVSILRIVAQLLETSVLLSPCQDAFHEMKRERLNNSDPNKPY